MSETPREYGILHDTADDPPFEWWTVLEDGGALCICYEKNAAKRIMEAMEFFDDAALLDDDKPKDLG